MRDKKVRTAWRTLMEVMKQSGNFDLYPEEEMVIVNALWELERLRENRDKAIEYIKECGCYEEDTKVFCDDINIYELPKLLEILKGGNND